MQPSHRPTPQLALLTAAAAASLAASILWVHSQSPRTALSAHGFLHAAIAHSIADAPRGSFPPENPFFAGESLRYYWVFHALGAGVRAVAGVDALRAFEWIIAAAALALFPIGLALGRAALGSGVAGCIAAYLVLAGGKPFALPLVVWRALTDDPLFERPYLWGLVHPVLRAMRYFDPYSLYGPHLNFFFNVTARPLAIVAFFGVLLALWHALERGSARALGGLALACAACAAFSLIFGIGGIGALAGSLGCLLLWQHTLGRNRPRALAPLELRRVAAVLASMAVGLALAAPSFVHLLGASGSRGAADGGLGFLGPAEWASPLLAMLETAALAVPLACIGVARARGLRRCYLAVLLGAASILCTATAVVSLPIESQTNFFQAALVALAVGSAAALVDLRGTLSRAAAVALVAVYVPGAAFIVRAYLDRPPIPLARAGRELVRIPPESPRAQLYDWIRTATDPRAVFVIAPERPPRAMAGNTAELPALTHRMLFTVRPDHYIVAGEPELDRRVAIAWDLLEGRALSARDDSYVAALQRELFVIDDLPDVQRSARLRERYGRPAFHSGRISVYRWHPRPHGGDDG